jgi:hypothetical protein
MKDCSPDEFSIDQALIKLTQNTINHHHELMKTNILNIDERFDMCLYLNSLISQSKKIALNFETPNS